MHAWLAIFFHSAFAQIWPWLAFMANNYYMLMLVVIVVIVTVIMGSVVSETSEMFDASVHVWGL